MLGERTNRNTQHHSTASKALPPSSGLPPEHHENDHEEHLDEHRQNRVASKSEPISINNRRRDKLVPPNSLERYGLRLNMTSSVSPLRSRRVGVMTEQRKACNV
jgi:hypothetical protein